MARKPDIQLAKQLAMKRIKSAVRLEASVRADVILNEILDEFSSEFDRRVAAGEPYELTGYSDWVFNAVEQRIPLTLTSGRS